jgi:hypothetical protein
MTNLHEDPLSKIFADGVRDMPELCYWLLSKTKFASHANGCRLLHEEQVRSRPRVRPENWWRHWWCYVPELSKESETDIFMVFQIFSTRERFALHIENKTKKGEFEPCQAAAYAPRARHMLGKPKFLSYSSFQTALLAPRSFRDSHALEANLFDFPIAYEEVAAFLSSFAVL